ncbi:sulfatase-like hydrolase/transferase [Haloferax sp. MBLA0076]|uniref:Sulfatase-like hydrolase/transferase n=1 Tax=Haloferax litoreum TaxID=2666140 RepID=A0A6A8GJW3_9EURY|nr:MULTISPECIES: arylsulfatase [Haloferax]KAB1190579.1 sulfatase-like hydrolase/transferase [Haloferax sp. CBA1148]MRX23568.1 sulfatase-like hydrolase/transferase [Haloferax litoreum]
MSNREFHGQIGRTYDESEPWWPEETRAPEDAPNVLMVVLDDVGFGQLGCYGGLVDTPNIDRLADNGLRYNNFHTTALCSPTRSCLLTGRNHHSNGMAGITEISTGFPGYNGHIPHENGFLSEILVGEGFNTFAMGKWHLAPAESTSAAGPYDGWPLGRGFERFYGFLGGDTDQYTPTLVHDNHQTEPPATPEEGYHFTEDLATRTIEFIGDAKQVDPDKPFFTYFAPGACHAPHQVPQEWADKYEGKFDMGWDEAREKILERQKKMGIVPENTALSPQNPDVNRWDSLSEDEQRLYARMMEVFAGFLEHTDAQIGKVLDYLDELGELDNTLVMLVSDNGASAEGGHSGSVNENRFFNNVPESLEENLEAMDELGGPKYFNHYPWGWTWAGDTPFQRWKRETHRGGTSDPLVVSWPDGIDTRGEIRDQFVHAIDLVPTILETVGIDAPDEVKGYSQSPIEGTSFVYSFDEPDAPEQHTTQYFEMLGTRAIYHDGWRAVRPWPFGKPMTAEDLSATTLEESGWELYHLEEDFSEAHDVASEHPEKVLELAQLWWTEAGKYDVLPLDGRGIQRFAETRPQPGKAREKYVYYPGTQHVPENAAVKVFNRDHSITADITVPEGGAEGVLLAHGARSGGYSLYVEDNHLRYVHNYVGIEEFEIAADDPIPEGEVSVRMEFEVTGEPDMSEGKGAPGTVRLYYGDEQVGEGEVPMTIPITMGLTAGLSCGRDAVNAVSDTYRDRTPFAFTGDITRVTVDVSGEPFVHEEAEMDQIMARE